MAAICQQANAAARAKRFPCSWWSLKIHVQKHSTDVKGNLTRLRKEEFGPFSATTDKAAQFYLLGFLN